MPSQPESDPSPARTGPRNAFSWSRDAPFDRSPTTAADTATRGLAPEDVPDEPDEVPDKPDEVLFETIRRFKGMERDVVGEDLVSLLVEHEIGVIRHDLDLLELAPTNVGAE